MFLKCQTFAFHLDGLYHYLRTTLTIIQSLPLNLLLKTEILLFWKISLCAMPPLKIVICIYVPPQNYGLWLMYYPKKSLLCHSIAHALHWETLTETSPFISQRRNVRFRRSADLSQVTQLVSNWNGTPSFLTDNTALHHPLLWGTRFVPILLSKL